MASNPMQRKTRNSFLLGMLLMLLIAGSIIAILLYQLMKMKEEEAQEIQSSVSVYVLNKDVESGGEITAADLTLAEVLSSVAPTNPISLDSLGETNIAKINLTQGTIVSADMLYIDTTTTGDDVRRQEYNSVVLPMDLATGDYVDIRLMLPSGQDYIVVSKKQVEIPQIAGMDSADTIFMLMSEDEILMMSNAIVDAYMVSGSKLYATKYSEPGNQEAATPTYVVSNEVAQLINSDPNIVEEAREALAERYNANLSLRQNYINAAINNQNDALGNEEAAMEESITNSQAAREEYLESLSVTTSTTTE